MDSSELHQVRPASSLIKMGDLAGSEKTRKTQATGQRLLEAKMIKEQVHSLPRPDFFMKKILSETENHLYLRVQTEFDLHIRRF